MSRRRFKDEKPISMFAFQDVITSVMGAMLMITMIMALDLAVRVTDKAAEATEQAQLDASGAGDDSTEELTARAEKLEAAYAKKHRVMAQLGALVPGRDTDQARALAVELQALSAEVRRVEAEILARQEKVKGEVSSQAMKDLLAKQAEYEQRIAKLKAQVDGLRVNPRLSYVVPQGISEQPLLLEIKANQLTLATAKAGGDMNALIGENAGDALGQLAQVIRGLDPKEVYFFLLVRPSAFGSEGIGEQVEKMLNEKGFRYGKDLLEEKTRVMPFDAP